MCILLFFPCNHSTKTVLYTCCDCMSLTTTFSDAIVQSGDVLAICALFVIYY